MGTVPQGSHIFEEPKIIVLLVSQAHFARPGGRWAAYFGFFNLKSETEGKLPLQYILCLTLILK